MGSLARALVLAGVSRPRRSSRVTRTLAAATCTRCSACGSFLGVAGEALRGVWTYLCSEV